MDQFLTLYKKKLNETNETFSHKNSSSICLLKESKNNHLSLIKMKSNINSVRLENSTFIERSMDFRCIYASR